MIPRPWLYDFWLYILTLIVWHLTWYWPWFWSLCLVGLKLLSPLHLHRTVDNLVVGQRLKSLHLYHMNLFKRIVPIRLNHYEKSINSPLHWNFTAAFNWPSWLSLHLYLQHLPVFILIISNFITCTFTLLI